MLSLLLEAGVRATLIALGRPRPAGDARQRLSDPEARTRLHAMGVLRELARSSLADCEGAAYSPEHAEAWAFCGFPPAAIRTPGSFAQSLSSLGANHSPCFLAPC